VADGWVAVGIERGVNRRPMPSLCRCLRRPQCDTNATQMHGRRLLTQVCAALGADDLCAGHEGDRHVHHLHHMIGVDGLWGVGG